MDWKLQEPPERENITLRGAGIRGLEPPTDEDVLYENELNLLETSRYKSTKIIKYEDGTCFELWDIPAFSVSESDDMFYEVPAHQAQRLDLISSTIYGTVNLWWIIAIVNDISNPFEEAESGKMLRIPSITDIFSTLATRV